MAEKDTRFKVLLVSPYSDKLVGGIINWTRYIVNYHSGHDEEVDLTLLYNENAEQVMGGGGILQRLKSGINNYLPVYRDFKDKVKKNQYDVVHICSSASFGFMRDLCIADAARKRGIKICIHMHFGRIPEILRSKGWERKLLMALVKKVDRVVVMDTASYRALCDIGYENVSNLPNPLSSEVLELVKKNTNNERTQRKIVYAGHVVETKGVFELVKACRDISEVKLDVLGKEAVAGTYEKLLELAGNNYEKWFCALGNRTLEEVIISMKTCNVFVLPSHSEGFPNVILESMACGCPIIATAVGAIPEMLATDSETPCGVCVPPKDVTALKNAIVEMLENPQKAQAMGENARERVLENYTMPKVWRQLVEIWENLLTN